MTILAATDGSERSLRSLPYASALARMAGVQVTLLRVLDPRQDIKDVFAPRVDEAVATVKEQWTEQMTALLQARAIEGQPLVLRKERAEETAQSIIRAAEETGALAIAIDTRGHGALRHALLGSVALDILKRSRLPVLATGPNIAPKAPETFKRILLAHDGSEAANDVLPDLQPLVRNSTVAITAIRVLSGEAEAAKAGEVEKQLRDMATALGDNVPVTPRVRIIPSLGGIQAAIIAEAEESGADLIALSTHGYSAARHLVAGSTALGILSQTRLPVLLGRKG